MISGEEIRRVTSGFVVEAIKCRTAEDAKDLLKRVEKFYLDNDIPLVYKKGDWQAEYDEFDRQGVGEMLGMMIY